MIDRLSWKTIALRTRVKGEDAPGDHVGSDLNESRTAQNPCPPADCITVAFLLQLSANQNGISLMNGFAQGFDKNLRGYIHVFFAASAAVATSAAVNFFVQ